MPQVYKSWIIAGFLFAFSMSRTSIAQSPLDEFLERLESSGAHALIKSATDRDGSISSSFKFNGDFGINSSTFRGTERRWIWNSNYIALIEKTGEADWSLQRLLYPNSEVYTNALKSSTTATHVFGGPLLRCVKSLDPNYTVDESEESAYEYQLLPDHPNYSMDPAWNSMEFRFDRNDEGSWLKEIKFYESSGGPGNELAIEWILTLDYPENTLFPVDLVAKGSFVSGTISGFRDEDLWKKSRVELDKEVKLDRTECYLKFYGLPEPKIARRDKTWAWFLLGALLAIGAGAAFWNRYKK